MCEASPPGGSKYHRVDPKKRVQIMKRLVFAGVASLLLSLTIVGPVSAGAKPQVTQARFKLPITELVDTGPHFAWKLSSQQYAIPWQWPEKQPKSAFRNHGFIAEYQKEYLKGVYSFAAQITEFSARGGAAWYFFDVKQQIKANQRSHIRWGIGQHSFGEASVNFAAFAFSQGRYVVEFTAGSRYGESRRRGCEVGGEARELQHQKLHVEAERAPDSEVLGAFWIVW
jgi:hypothetical protein